MIISYADALKAFRRGVHVNKQLWRGAVICANAGQLDIAWDEATHILRASSVGLKEAKRVTNTLTTPDGAILRFYIAPDMTRALNMRGAEFTQVIFAFDPPADVQEMIGTLLRLNENVKDGLRMDIAIL